MSAFCLNYIMNINLGRKSRTYPYNHWRHIYISSRIALCHDGVYDDIRTQAGYGIPLGVYDNGYALYAGKSIG